MSTVADRFLALRNALGWKQEEFVDRSEEGIARTEISKIENGENQLTGSKLRGKIARVLGVSADELGDYVQGRTTLASMLERIQGGKPRSSPPPPVEGYPIPDDVRAEATVFLKQGPYGLTEDAIEIAFRRYRCLDPEAAQDPSAVADGIRTVVLGPHRTTKPSSLPPMQTRRSLRR